MSTYSQVFLWAMFVLVLICLKTGKDKFRIDVDNTGLIVMGESWSRWAFECEN